jgi:hypothetical protein
MSRPQLITSERVLALMRSRPFAPLTYAEAGDLLGCTPEAAGNILRGMANAGRIVCTTGRSNSKLYTLPPEERTAASASGEIVQPFRNNIWKAPLKGYEASLRAAADLAMATRRA